MIDTEALTKAVHQQINTAITEQVMQVMTGDAWLAPLEERVIKYAQDRILGKFSNASAVPELVAVIKTSVKELFDQGLVPSIGQFIDQTAIRQAVDQAVENTITDTMNTLEKDPVWLTKIQNMINQTVVQRTLAGLNSIDVSEVIRQRVDEQFQTIKQQILPGIQDQATGTELTVLDGNVVVENQFTTKNLTVVRDTTVNNLVVKGDINTDNRSWQPLANAVAEKVLLKIDDTRQANLVAAVTTKIQENGIDLSTVKIDGQLLVNGNALASTITQTNIQKLGLLKDLQVQGETALCNTLYIVNKRLGVNTDKPETALSIWDEEVSIIAGKSGANRAYLGTSRLQNLALGVNREAQIEVDIDGLTTIKKLRIDRFKIGFAETVPNYSGNKGDLIFNTNHKTDHVFAWVCLGAFRWQTLKSA